MKTTENDSPLAPPSPCVNSTVVTYPWRCETRPVDAPRVGRTDGRTSGRRPPGERVKGGARVINYATALAGGSLEVWRGCFTKDAD